MATQAAPLRSARLNCLPKALPLASRSTASPNRLNATASAAWSAGLELKKLQTGRLRQYVMFIVVGTVALYVLASMLLSSSLAG